MKVELITHMGSDLLVCNAARASFSKEKQEFDALKDGSLLRFLARGYSDREWNDVAMAFAECTSVESVKKMLTTVRQKQTHFAPFCHPQASFRVETSLAVARQLWKSHIGAVGGDSGYAAWSEASRRYITEDPEYDWPKEWRMQAVNVKQGSGGAMDWQGQLAMAGIADTASSKATHDYRAMVDAFLVAPEQARYFLPSATVTSWVWTGSLMFWSRLAWLRLEPHAQAETREVVQAIADECRELWPASWEALVGGE